MNNETKPKVSVVLITYFHEKYVRKALESILFQKTNFSFEIIAGDDGSTDGTQEIIKEFAEKYPDKIKPILRPKNLGATKNCYDLYMRAKGEYIAPIEGDDFWTDSEKLQKQVDFLDNHKDFIGCAHKCVVVDENNKPNYNLSPHWTIPKKVFTLDDFLKNETLPSQSSTEVFRNIFLDKSKDYSAFYRIHPIVGDKTRLFILLSKGKYYTFNDVMSAYRFVIKKTGKNWFSIHHSNKNWQYDAFMRPVKLQRYAESIGIKAEIGPKRDYHYTSLVDDIIKEPNLTRIKNLTEMTIASKKPIHCLSLIAKYLIVK